jgi:hypothetical protein
MYADVVRAMRMTSTISTCLNGEMTFAARHFARNGKRILFSDSNTNSGPALMASLWIRSSRTGSLLRPPHNLAPRIRLAELRPPLHNTTTSFPPHMAPLDRAIRSVLVPISSGSKRCISVP